MDPTFSGGPGDLSHVEPFTWLAEFELPTDPPTRYRITNRELPVDFGQTSAGVDLTYEPYGVDIGQISSNVKGDLRTVQVTIPSVNDDLRQALDDYNGLAGQPCVIRIIHEGEADKQMRFDMTVVGTQVSGESVSFSIGDRSLYEAYVPNRRHTAHHCIFQFADAECGYLGPIDPANTVADGFDFCPNTFSGCEDRGAAELDADVTVRHPERFGGSPGIAVAPD